MPQHLPQWVANLVERGSNFLEKQGYEQSYKNGDGATSMPFPNPMGTHANVCERFGNGQVQAAVTHKMLRESMGHLVSVRISPTGPQQCP